MITEFKDYRDLHFLTKEMQDELFKRHDHAEAVYQEDKDSVVYKEKDVLILLQMLLREKYPELHDHEKQS